MLLRETVFDRYSEQPWPCRPVPAPSGYVSPDCVGCNEVLWNTYRRPSSLELSVPDLKNVPRSSWSVLLVYVFTVRVRTLRHRYGGPTELKVGETPV